jgi:hypothetical protein
MECQGVGGETEPLGDLAGGQALRPGLHQQPKNLQAVFLGQRRQGRDCF